MHFIQFHRNQTNCIRFLKLKTYVHVQQGELFQILEDDTKLPEVEVRKIAMQLVRVNDNRDVQKNKLLSFPN